MLSVLPLTKYSDDTHPRRCAAGLVEQHPSVKQIVISNHSRMTTTARLSRGVSDGADRLLDVCVGHVGCRAARVEEKRHHPAVVAGASRVQEGENFVKRQ